MKLSSEQRHILMKCSEELSELSVELLHALNKPKKQNKQKIKLEIQDVEYYLEKLKECLDISQN